MKDYVITVLGFLFIGGSVNFLTIMSSLFSPYGYDPIVIASFGVIFTLFGMVGSLISGVINDKYKCYLTIYRVSCVCSVITFALLLWTGPSGNAWLLGANMAVGGLTISPIGPTAISLAAELSFPLKETVSNGLLTLSSAIGAWSVSMIAAGLTLISPFYAFGLFSACAVAGMICSIFIVQTLGRTNYRLSSNKPVEKLDEDNIIADSIKE